MKVFVPGATGFIGSYLVPKLIAQGDDVHILVRDAQNASAFQEAGCTVHVGDITQKETIRSGMAGSQIVYHSAGYYRFGDKHGKQISQETNVTGSSNIF
ncbi:MAG: NAD(P)H-binding protein, partial [Chloroflexota bacterium]